jgi:hypothetical protein
MTGEQIATRRTRGASNNLSLVWMYSLVGLQIASRDWYENAFFSIIKNCISYTVTKSHLKGWIWLLMSCMVSSGPKKGTRPVFKFLRCSNAFTTKRIHKSRFPCFLFICQRSLGHFFRFRPLLPIGWRIVQILRQRRRTMTNTVPTNLSIIQAVRQSIFINEQLYSTCDCRNDKNKQLTSLSQRKLALIARNTLFAL